MIIFYQACIKLIWLINVHTQHWPRTNVNNRLYFIIIISICQTVDTPRHNVVVDMKVIVCCLTYRHNNTKFSLIYKKGILKDAFLLFCIWYREPDLVKPARPRNFHTISIANNLKNFLADCHVLLLKIEYIWWAEGVRTAQNGSSQGRKPDDECHRLRRGREKFGTNFIVT